MTRRALLAGLAAIACWTAATTVPARADLPAAMRPPEVH